MGQPVFNPGRIPVIPGSLGLTTKEFAPLLNEEVDFGKFGKFKVSTASMGNPHCVIFVDDTETAPVEELGAFIENHPAFPERTNVEFVSIQKDGSLRQRTFERGSGETLSCGTGACAVLAVSSVLGVGPSRNKIHLRGGTLEVDWTGSFDKPDSIFLRGAATLVFEGSIECPENHAV
jgi:diaminopimelate epimerase